MEIRAWKFLAFWGVASTVFLDLGFRVLDNTQLSKSVSPVTMSLFKHALAISSCLSSSYALVFSAIRSYDSRSQNLLFVNVIVCLYLRRTIDGIIFTAIFSRIWIICAPFVETLFVIFVIVLLCCFFVFLFYHSSRYSIFQLIFWSTISFLSCKGIITYWSKYELYEEIGLIPIIWFMVQWVCLCIISVLVLRFIASMFLEELSLRMVILMFWHSYLFFVGGEKTDFSPILVVFISHLISTLWAVSSMKGGRFPKLVRVVSKVKNVYSRFEDKVGILFRTLIKIAVGLLGSILFQNFFQVTSFNEALAFVCFAAMWLANLTLLGVSNDFDVFFFLLFNMVVGSMQNEFELRRNTWLAYGFAILLSGIRLYLKSVTVNYGIGQYIKIPCDWCFQRSTPTENEGSDFELEVKVEL